MTFILLDKDIRGYGIQFQCSNCGAFIYTDHSVKDIDYNYCPYCGDKVEDEND